MKRNELMALIATTILMFAVCMSASAKGKRNVERGMTKQEVIAILGEPKLTSFDMYGDKWEYAKYNNLFGDSKYITVFFDRNGKVVQYDTRIIEPNSQTSNVQQPQHPTPPIYDGRCDPDGRMDYGYCLDDAFRKEQLQWVAAIDREEYYIRMMQAWYFATALAKQWEATLPVVATLTDWVRRKTIQKAVESYRITDERKDLLKSLRRKD